MRAKVIQGITIILAIFVVYWWSQWTLPGTPGYYRYMRIREGMTQEEVIAQLGHGSALDVPRDEFGIGVDRRHPVRLGKPASSVDVLIRWGWNSNGHLYKISIGFRNGRVVFKQLVHLGL
jgi:hypothetical protein